MVPDAANVCPRDENGTPENPQKIMGPRWGRLRGPRAVPNGLLKGSLFRRLVYTRFELRSWKHYEDEQQNKPGAPGGIPDAELGTKTSI